MKHKNPVKMDRKKTRRRKSIAGKRHGRMEEKPTSTEVMNEKEKQDRLEAASALSSLMFLPPKSPKDENEGTDNLGTPSASVTQISFQSTTSGIPTTSQLTSLVQGVGGRSGVSPTSVSENAVNLKNSMILAQLQNELNIALKHRNIQPFSNPTPPTQAAPKVASNVPVKSKDPKADKRDSQNVPLTVIPQSLTVSKTVAKALRQVVSNNKLRAAETPQSNDRFQKIDPERYENAEKSNNQSVSGPFTEDEHEKMECESLPSSRNADTNLPLKKRRLIGVIDDSLSTADLTLTSSTLNANLDTLNSTRQIENILQMAKDYPVTSSNSTVNLNLVSGVIPSKLQEGEGYRPVQFDPRTSLMVLSDLKFALTPDEDGDLPLHIAVVHENTELVKRFIDIMAISGKTVDRFNKLQQTPLHLAVLVDKPEIIAVLLAAGANPNLLDRNGCTSVHIAVNKQLPACMDTVFRNSKYTVNINTRDYEGYYPLHTCVELDDLKMMMSLIERGADKDCQDGKAGRSVLLYAVEYSRSDIVQYLLNQGANPDLQNYAGVSPMMTAHAANMEEIISHLNKAIDNNEKYDENYIPSKKVPIARIPSKNAQIVNKDSKIGKVLQRVEQPLIYHEYESDPESGFDKIKREPLSRQSSVSSPIDLSMRRNSESPLPPPPELTIRGKPGKRKTKREPKNHKEKLQQKSVLKEKHASVVAALESRMFVDKKYEIKAKAAGKDFSEMESSVKSELFDEGYDKSKTDNDEENVDVDTVRKKSSSVALSNFILSLKPDQTKQLVEKVKEHINLRSDGAQLNLASPFKTMSNSYDKTEHNIEKHQEGNIEKMQVDLETGGDSSKNYDFQKDSESEYPSILEKNDERVCVNMSEQESSNEVNVAERMDDDSVNLNCDNETMESTVMQVQYESKLIENNDTEESYDIDDADDIRDSPGHVNQTELSVRTITEESETFSNSLHGSEPGVNEASDSKEIETEAADNDSIPIDKQNMAENADTEDRNAGSKGTNCSKIIEKTNSESMAVGLTSEKKSLNDKYKSQVSQDSQGFEVASSGIESSSPPLVKINKVLETVEQQLNYSESLMETEDSSAETTEDHQTGDEEKNSSSGSDNEKTSAEEGSNFEPVTEEKESNASVETDEEDNGLVIDEHISEDENSGNVDHFEKSALNDQEIVKGTSESGVVIGTVSGNESKEVSMEEDINVKEKSDDSDSVSGGKFKINKSVQGINNGLKSKLRGKKGKEKQIAKEKQADADFDNSEKFFATAVSVVKTSPTVFNNTSSIISTLSSKDKETNSKPETYKGQVEANSTEDILQKGQSHTLYYHDGDGYKPVKIFIDNSEQSSLVLQRMFQTAQLSNLKRQVDRATSGNVKGPDLVSETKKLPNLNANVMSLSRMSGPLTKDSVPHSDGSVETSGNSLNKTALDTSSSISLTKETIPTKNVVISSVASNPMETMKDSFQQAYIDSLKIKSNEESASNNNTEHTKKRIHTHLTKKPVVQSVSKIENKGKVTSEGTLTRVNPDIRSKLSKALQSPQRRVGNVRSDSDVSIVNSRGIMSHSLSSVSYTVHTPVTDTRQQL